MDQQGANLGGMMSCEFPPCPLWPPPWCMYQAMPGLYNSSPYWLSNRIYEAGPATPDQLIGINTPTHTTININVNGQHHVVDENKVPQQELQGFLTTPDDEERKPPIHDLPKTNDLTNGTCDKLSKPNAGEQNFAREKKEVSDESQHPDEFHTENRSSALRKQCSCPCSCTEKNTSPVVSGSKTQDQVHQIDVIQEPRHILSDVVESFGERLNVLVTHVHRMSSNRVKFHIETEVWQGEDHHRRLSLTREEPVTDPSDSDRYPEAFDCRRILKHMRKRHNVRTYARILDCSRPEDLKREIDGILGRIPGKTTSRSPRPTWDSLIDTLHKMKSFIEQAAAGLRRNNEDILAAELDKGYDSLEASIAKAAKAQEMSHK